MEESGALPPSAIAPTQVRQQQSIEAPMHENILSTRFVGRLEKATQTPSVQNCEKWIAVNTGAQSILDFVDGQEGQTLKILGEGFTTVQNTANIKTNTGANKLLLANIVYTFTMFSGVWVEDE